MRNHWPAALVLCLVLSALAGFSRPAAAGGPGVSGSSISTASRTLLRHGSGRGLDPRIPSLRTDGPVPAGPGCTHSHGYWKTHTGEWPVTSLAISGVTYTQAQLVSILAQGGGGNSLVGLMRQLVAAKLNIASGANPAPIAASIAAAEALINGRVAPPVGNGALTSGQSGTLAATLEAYDLGNVGVPHCTEGISPARVQTWGALKSLYR